MPCPFLLRELTALPTLGHWEEYIVARLKQIYWVGLLVPMTIGLAQADIYKYVDDSGRVTYTNIPRKGAKKLDLGPTTVNTVPASRPKGAASPSDFPRVNEEDQKKRDDLRKKLLQDELAAEQQRLAEAKKNLEEGKAVRMGNERNYQKYLDRVQGLQDEVTLHEKNVQALQKELGGLN